MRISVILVAAGSGSRLGAEVPKAFVTVASRTLLRRAVETISAVPSREEIVIAVPSGMEAQARQEISPLGTNLPIKILAGGVERQDSVRIALALTSAETELVAIHDAARPFADVELFNRCIEQAAARGSAIAAIPLSDTLKRGADGRVNGTVPRIGLWLAQTPQVFRRDTLIRAHQEAEMAGFRGTDDAELVERIGAPIALVVGSPLNIKITTADDLKLAEAIASMRSPH